MPLHAQAGWCGNDGMSGCELWGQARSSIAIIRVTPAARAAQGVLGDSCGSALEWLPLPPHDLLLVSCRPVLPLLA